MRRALTTRKPTLNSFTKLRRTRTRKRTVSAGKVVASHWCCCSHWDIRWDHSRFHFDGSHLHFLSSESIAAARSLLIYLYRYWQFRNIYRRRFTQPMIATCPRCHFCRSRRLCLHFVGISMPTSEREKESLIVSRVLIRRSARADYECSEGFSRLQRTQVGDCEYGASLFQIHLEPSPLSYPAMELSWGTRRWFLWLKAPFKRRPQSIAEAQAKCLAICSFLLWFLVCTDSEKKYK